MRLRANFIDKVGNGKDIYKMLMSTATGTGGGAIGYKVGVCCLDRSSNNWFLCTASTASGTWVQINA